MVHCGVFALATGTLHLPSHGDSFFSRRTQRPISNSQTFRAQNTVTLRGYHICLSPNPQFNSNHVNALPAKLA